MSSIALEDAEAIIRIASKSPAEHDALPEETRIALTMALEKLKITIQTPAEAAMELFEGVSNE